MKLSNFAKIAGASALSLSLTVFSLSAPSFAQDAPAVDGTTTTEDVDAAEGDRDFDWGWLGLLGLIGLAGLARKDEPATRYREPEGVSRSSNRI